MSASVKFLDIDEFFDSLAHIGTPRHSGRYPWGSGDTPYQRYKGFLQYVDDLKKKGMTESEIAKGLGLKSTTELRAMRSIAVTNKRNDDISMARKLRDKGLSNVAIGERMGIGESTVRSFLDEGLKERTNRLQNTADFLKSRVDDDGFIDVGAGSEHFLGVSAQRKATAIAMLKDEGYQVFYYKTEQLGTGKETNIMVLAKPDKSFKDLTADPSQIKSVAAYSEDGGATFRKIEPPESVSSKRLTVRYGDEGGADKDGVIELRRGVDDLSLGNAQYAQVRIAVDKSHYLKGMAMYADDLPDGVDIRFNTNKAKSDNKLDALKPLKKVKGDDNVEYIDDDMPFGAMVRQKTYIGKDGKQKLSPINIVGSKKTDDNGKDISFAGEEGAWDKWSKTLSSQMLSKQTPDLAKAQLDITYRTKKDDLDEIMSLTNPVVKRKLLEEFADGADSSAVHLKAAGLPRTAARVILPVNSLKDNEVYAPTYKNGEKVVLIRHPHGGTFEIPELVVNNKNREALRVLKQAKDAVGINSKVASRLSGADFDGDTVLVIPNNSGRIKTSAPLAGLKNFDPQADYKMPKGVSNNLSGKTKQTMMGEVSNLITDMSIKGAPHSEIARAVRHSMVVIDAEKHNLNYKQSFKDNNIKELRAKYQNSASGGASTLISRAKSTAKVNERKPRSVKDGGPIDPKTGEKMWEYTNASYVDAKGKVKMVPGAKSTKMAEAKDAHDLVSSNGGTRMERIYADHANKLKALANTARKEAYSTQSPKQNALAKKTYAHEVSVLKSKLNVAQKNAPLERQAQLIAKATVTAKRQSNPGLDSDGIRKLKAQALEQARIKVGANKERVKFTPREWEAVQAGAISGNVLSSLLRNADMDQVKQLATPRDRPVMTKSKTARAKSMLNAGYTQAEIADALGVATSTLNDVL